MMRVTSEMDNAIRARRTYKKVLDNQTIVRARDCEYDITYTNAADIRSRIQEML